MEEEKMNKKLFGLLLLGSMVLVLSGCAGGGSGDDDYVPAHDVHYLTDDLGTGIPDVEFYCTSGYYGYTGPAGGYDFDANGDECTLILDSNEAYTGQSLYIEDEYGPIDGIYYTCLNYDTSLNPYTGDTIGAGHFNHVFDYDECTFNY
jgi:hypothetical protein